MKAKSVSLYPCFYIAFYISLALLTPPASGETTTGFLRVELVLKYERAKPVAGRFFQYILLELIPWIYKQ